MNGDLGRSNYFGGEDARELWGGAVELELPKKFLDVSSMRDVPDHQECFVDASSDRCVILEILERQDGLEDILAPKFFFENLAEETGSEEFELEVVKNGLQPSSVPCVGVFPVKSSAHLAVGTMMMSKFNERNAMNKVRVYLCVIRLGKPYNSDILITFNSPIRINPNSSSFTVDKTDVRTNREAEARTAEEERIFSQILKTFVIKQPQLFGGSEQDWS